MSNVDGTWNMVTKSPMGDQKGTLVVKSDGTSFTGTTTSAMGAADITDGAIDGDTLTWSVKMSMPMPMTLICTATIAADSFTGVVDAGAFGKMAMTGVRA